MRISILQSRPFSLIGLGDRFFIDEDFISFSTQNEKWRTHEVELHFISGKAHTMSVTGKEMGAKPKGFVDNFAWGRLVLGEKDSLTLVDGNDKAGGALYLNVLSLARGLKQLDVINSNGLNMYYNPEAPGNAYLAGGIYQLQGGGVLAPAHPPAPALQNTPGNGQAIDGASESAPETPAKRKKPHWWELLGMRPE